MTVGIDTIIDTVSVADLDGGGQKDDVDIRFHTTESFPFAQATCQFTGSPTISSWNAGSVRFKNLAPGKHQANITARIQTPGGLYTDLTPRWHLRSRGGGGCAAQLYVTPQACVTTPATCSLPVRVGGVLGDAAERVGVVGKWAALGAHGLVGRGVVVEVCDAPTAVEWRHFFWSGDGPYLDPEGICPGQMVLAGWLRDVRPVSSMRLVNRELAAGPLKRLPGQCRPPRSTTQAPGQQSADAEGAPRIGHGRTRPRARRRPPICPAACIRCATGRGRRDVNPVRLAITAGPSVR
uniref:hypothetical protein n=1 Tax=Streptomyces sp. NBC_01562 TaxID=2975879 RepID=UPI002F90D016